MKNEILSQDFNEKNLHLQFTYTQNGRENWFTK